MNDVPTVNKMVKYETDGWYLNSSRGTGMHFLITTFRMAIGPTEPPGQQTTGAVLPGGK
jgi:hypothetical protein